MKKIVLAFLSISLVALFLAPNLYAFPVNFDTQALYSWGRDYIPTDTTGNGVMDTAVPIAGLGAGPDLGFSYDNPYPGSHANLINNPTQALPLDTFKVADGTEDQWGIVRLDKVTDLIANPVISPPSGGEFNIVFYGGDDIFFSGGGSALNAPFGSIYSQGLALEIWSDPTGAGDHGNAASTGTSIRNVGADPTHFDTLTDEPGATLLMSLIAHSQPFDSNLNGIIDAGDMTFDTLSQPALWPLTYNTTALLDVVPGSGPWADLFDTNTRAYGSDFDFVVGLFDNLPSAQGFGIGKTAGDPDDMWRFHDQPSVRGDLVPEPATMLLLGSGLIGLAGFGRKKKFFKKS